jgi:hypothetical protein
MNRAAALILALPLLTLGCDLDAWIKRAKSERRSAETHERDESDEPRRSTKREPTAQAPEPTTSPSAFPATELPPPVNYLATPQDILTRLREKTGCKPCRVTRFSFRPHSARFQLQDPREPLNLDEYWLNGHRFAEPAPIKFSSKPTLEKLRNTTFDLEQDINLAALKGMIDAAPRNSQVEGATVTHVVIHNNLIPGDGLVVNVYVDAPRRSGYVSYAANGKVLRVYN